MTEEQRKKESKIEKIKNIIKRYRAEKEEYLEGWKRAKADLENYKKDEFSRISSTVESEKRKTILKFLQVLDNFYRAEKETKNKDSDNIIDGFLIIKKQIEEVLREEGVEPIDALGKEFDPEFHEAVEMIESESESGTVVEELEKGYLLNGKVIRATKVKVAK